MPLVLAMPTAAPVLPGDRRRPMPMKWTGFDGSEWDLSNPDGVMSMSKGVKGLHMPPFTVFSSSTPLVPGEDLTGYAIPARPVYWPLNFYSDSIDEWHQVHGGFFRSFHPTQPGVWTVGEGDRARTLELTGVFDGSYAFEHDPFTLGWALIGVELRAPRPLWRARAISKTFRAEAPVDFIPVEEGETYHPTPTATFATASIDNPGDEPSYLTWTVVGPQDAGLEVGVGGATVDVPFDVAAGSVLTIDTDPAGQFASLDGVDCTEQLGFQVFAPIPARGTTALTIRSSGDGAVTAAHTPLYWAAF